MPEPVKLDLTEVDGNAYAVLGAFKREARRAGWTPDEIKEVIDKAMSDDYNNLIATIMENTCD